MPLVEPGEALPDPASADVEPERRRHRDRRQQGRGLTLLELRDSIITATRRALCGEVPESDGRNCIGDGGDLSGGSALVVTDGARVTMDGFVLSDSAIPDRTDLIGPHR